MTTKTQKTPPVALGSGDLLDSEDVANKVDALIGYIEVMRKHLSPWQIPHELPEVLEEAERWVSSLRSNTKQSDA